MTFTVDRTTTAVVGLGHPSARLLAGKDTREDFAEHKERLGPLPPWPAEAEAALGIVERSGLAGRGGGYFPLARKISTAMRAEGAPVVVVNATESEPASRKDRLLLAARPHLILDGAEAIRTAVGGDRVIVAVHGHGGNYRSIRAAATERGSESVPAQVVVVPDSYIAGESSALVSYLSGGPALPPSRTHPTAVRGVDGLPTVVSNAETVSHVALIARFGPEWFRAIAPGGHTGSVLLTVVGDVAGSGQVVEVVSPVTIGEVLQATGPLPASPQAILLGGYAGTWMRGQEALDAPLAAASLSLGCGLVGVLGPGRCGLVEAAHLLNWLSSQQAGQCGACVYGLPDMAERFGALSNGGARGRRHVRKIVSLGDTISGRGVCGLPDGAVAMAESALSVFGDELKLHRKGRCRGQGGRVFPLPGPGELWGR